MTRKVEKRVSSTPAQNQSEVGERTGQSPSADSWLVSHQQGSISDKETAKHKQEEAARLYPKSSRLDFWALEST